MAAECCSTFFLMLQVWPILFQDISNAHNTFQNLRSRLRKFMEWSSKCLSSQMGCLLGIFNTLSRWFWQATIWTLQDLLAYVKKSLCMKAAKLGLFTPPLLSLAVIKAHYTMGQKQQGVGKQRGDEFRVGPDSNSCLNQPESTFPSWGKSSWTF